VTRLRAQRAEVWQQSYNLAQHAASANRAFDADEQRQWETLNDRLEQLDTRIGEHAEQHRNARNSDAAFARIEAQPLAGHRTVLPSPADIPAESLHGMHEALRSGQPYRVETRDLLGGADPTQTLPAFVAGDYTDTPRVASLFATQTTEAPTVRVYVASTTATAKVTSEASTKPSAGLALTPADVPVNKIATWQRLSYELVADFPAFVSQVHRELTRAVAAEENKQLTKTLTGADLQSQSNAGGNGIDSTASAIATLQAAGIQPDAIMLSPGRLAAIRQATATGSGTYYVDPQTAAPNTLHGLPVTVTPELPDTTVLVGAFAEAGTVYVRETISVRTGYDGADFSENMVSVVAEERLALAVTQPARIVNIDLGKSS
jgi:HK97 family phage major capsid protein